MLGYSPKMILAIFRIYTNYVANKGRIGQFFPVAKRSRFTPKETPSGWCLNVPAAFTTTGKRERWFFKTKKLAEEAAEPLRTRRDEFGTQWKNASPSEVENLAKAMELLAPWNKGVVQAVSEFAEVLAVLKPWGITPVAAAKMAAKQAKHEASSQSMAKAWTAFLATKSSKAEGTLKGYRQLRKSMEDHFGREKGLSRIGGTELESFLSATTKGKGAHRNARLRYLRAFWAWCSKPPRTWCAPEAAEMLEAVDVRQGDTIVLAPEKVRTLFKVAEKVFPDLVPWLGLSIFAGLRQAEIERLKPSEITAEGITVSARNKTGRRHIAMPPPLAAWLEAHPIKKSVLPADFAVQKDRLRRLAGWRVEAQGMRKPSLKLPLWPQNVLRHTAASVALGIGKPIDTLIFEHGHSGGVNTLKKHYLGVMTRAVAEKIWRNGPKGKDLPHLV